MSDLSKKTREAIFLKQVSFAPGIIQPKELTREEIVLDILYQSQQKAIKNNKLGDKPDLYSIAGMNMSNRCFSAINFDLLYEMRNVNAKNSNFSYPDQEQHPNTEHLTAKLGHSKIVDSDFSQANFSNCQMKMIFFDNSNFQETNLENVLINSGKATNINFQGAKFYNTQMINFSFEASNLLNSDFSKAGIYGHDNSFINRQIKPVFSKDCLLENMNLFDANLELVLFEENTLANVSFQQAIIKNSTFKNSLFKDVSFKNGSFFWVELEFSDQRQSVDFSNLDARAVTFKGSIQGNFFNTQFLNSDFREAYFLKADLEGVVFDNCQFRDKSVLDLEGAEFIECSFG